MQEDTSFRGDVIGLCISIKGRHTEGKGRHQRGLSSSLYNYSSKAIRLITTTKACLIGHDISNDQLITKQGDIIAF